MGIMRITGPVEIVANTNDWIDYKIGATEYNKQVPAGIYETWTDFSTAFITAVGASHIDGHPLQSGNTGRMTISWDNSTELLFADGHTKSAMSIRDVFGFEHVDVAAATSHVGSYQHGFGWYPSHTFARDTGDRRRSLGGELRTVLSGATSKRLQAGYLSTREVSFSLMEPEQIWEASATGANINKDFETLWSYLAKGYTCRIYDDRTVNTYKNYYLQSPSDLAEIVRPHPDIERYNLDLKLTLKA